MLATVLINAKQHAPLIISQPLMMNFDMSRDGVSSTELKIIDNQIYIIRKRILYDFARIEKASWFFADEMILDCAIKIF